MSASAKWSWARSRTESTTNEIRSNIINAVSHATIAGTTTTRECTSNMPDEQYNTYVWTVYRASSEENNGASQQTCTFQHQTGECRWVEPNCPIGMCKDLNCIYCAEGVTPIIPIPELRAQWPSCFAEVGRRNLRCRPDLDQWSCCSPSQPCPAGEGDCDSDDDCAGDLVCLQNPDSSSKFDICGYPTRRLLQAHTKMVEHSDPDDGVEQEKEHDQPRGCGQFDDEAHCETGPLYKFCQWNAVETVCSVKENVEESEIPDTDFTWIYDL